MQHLKPLITRAYPSLVEAALAANTVCAQSPGVRLRLTPGSRAGVGRRSFVVGPPPRATQPASSEAEAQTTAEPLTAPLTRGVPWLARAAQTNRSPPQSSRVGVKSGTGHGPPIAVGSAAG